MIRRFALPVPQGAGRQSANGIVTTLPPFSAANVIRFVTTNGLAQRAPVSSGPAHPSPNDSSSCLRVSANAARSVLLNASSSRFSVAR